MYLIKTFAEALTRAQLIAAVEGVIILLALFIKFVKEFKTVKENLLWFWMWCKSSLAWAKDKFWRKNVSEQLAKLQGTLDRVLKEQAEVRKEVTHNGGSSLKDAVKRLEQGQAIIMSDLDEKRQIRNAMQKFSDTMTFHMSAEGACTFINHAFLKFFGCNDEEVLMFAYENMVHDDDTMDMRNKINKASRTPTPFRDELRIRHKLTGRYHNVIMKADPIVVDGVVKFFYGTIEIIND